MRAWFACTGAELLARDAADTVGRLASVQAAQGLSASAEQIGAWEAQIARLREAVAANDGARWTVALEYDLIRLGKRIDAVVVTDRALLVLEFKTRDASPAALAEAEDYALDLRDFHAGSRAHPIVPILVTDEGAHDAPLQPPLIWHGVVPPLRSSGAALPAMIAWVQAQVPAPNRKLDGAAWLAAPYRPVPGIVEAATMLYARNGVGDIAAARADAANLTRTTEAIARAVERAKRDDARIVVFVTGIPGAGKTLCGLNAVFGPARQEGAAFLTGNAPLVTVLRAALAEDAVARRECGSAEARRRVGQALQNVHRFLEHYVLRPDEVPHERLIVFDEAQRAWDEAKARQGTQNRTSRLTMSEPAHTLEIMGRHAGWAVIVALIGNGQEINTGEAGLAEWHRVIEASATWQAAAAAPLVGSRPPPWLTVEPDLHLGVSMRSVRDVAAADWVEAVIAGEAERAQAIASGAGGVPFLLVRDAGEMREALRRLARGRRRAGLVRSAGAKRLRAEGLGAEVQGDDIAHWFLRRWPDVRGSDALEVCATEYACQGLELDVVGLAWGGDFIRGAGKEAGGGWEARRFAGTAWQREVSEFGFVRNTYRVLLTRARYETVIYVPRGDADDRTRDPATFEAIAAFLAACGAAAPCRESAVRLEEPRTLL
ncbi:DNA/RNA helicase domain-containing protein [Elioraea rosea]|uniref:DNA/RNA helicase domain-containing protein n=1 Tax=Elioraea rosea TaxID=2492390 RepID=UPI0011869424|nr:DNA/RNA helicase domain-containing protein [Elioraea rosea]